MDMMCRMTLSERSHLLADGDQRCHDDPSCWHSFNCQKKGTSYEHGISPDSSTPTTKRHTWLVIIFGQTITLALSCANAASSALENNYEIKVPTFQTGLVYFMLSFHLAYLFWRHRRKESNEAEEIPNHCENQSSAMQQLSIENSDTSSCDTTVRMQQSHNFPFTNLPLHTPWYIYLLLSILDVEANYLAMLSFQHTSLSSSMLLTSLSVLSTVLLRQVIFRSTNYSKKRWMGVVTCLVGGCLWLRADFDMYHGGDVDKRDLASDSLDTSNSTSESDRYIVYGDLLALSAACLYGLNDVLAEYFVKANNDRVEYLGMLGFFGAIFSFLVQVPLLERAQIQKLLPDLQSMHNGRTSGIIGSGNFFSSMMGAIFLLLCFIIMLCYFYMSVMAFLSAYDATILNLSLQTGPLWAVVLTGLQKSMKGDSNGWLLMPPPIFFVSLTMVMAGMFLYESHSETERNDGKKKEMEHINDSNIDRDNITDVT